MSAEDNQDPPLFNVNAARQVFEAWGKSLKDLPPIQPERPAIVGPQQFRWLVEQGFINERGQWLPPPQRTVRPKRKKKRHPR